jgi:hypothetical protein
MAKARSQPAMPRITHNATEGSRACRSCAEIKPMQEFALSKTSRGGRLARCRACVRESGRASRSLWLVRRKRHNRELIQKLKVERGCADCGYNKHPAALDFDHLPENSKLDRVSAMTMASLEKLLAELVKCEVVCANCHRVRTYERAQSARPPVSVGPKARRANPVVEARWFADLAAAGQLQRVIAGQVGRSQSYVSSRLKLLRLPSPMLDVFEASYSDDTEAPEPWSIKDAIAFVDEAKGSQPLMLAAYELRLRHPDMSPGELVLRVRSGGSQGDGT